MKHCMLAALAATVLLAATPAMAEVVVVVNSKAAEATLSKDQVAQVFLGKSTSFSPIEQGDGDAVRAEFYKKVLEKEPGQVKALWSKLVFTGKATMPKEASGSAAVKAAVAANPKAIGYIEKKDVDATVKVVFSAP